MKFCEISLNYAKNSYAKITHSLWKNYARSILIEYLIYAGTISATY